MKILLLVGKNHDTLPWRETRIFIEIDSACRNQQGDCYEVENSAGPFSLFFVYCCFYFMQ